MRTLMVAGLLVVLGGCGDDGGGDSADVPTCEELYADGTPVEEIQAENDKPLTDDAGCLTEDGEQEVQALFSFDCDDGRTVYANQYGYGYEGETWTYDTSDQRPEGC